MVDISDPKWAESDPSNNGAAPDGVQGSYPPNTVAPILRSTRGALKRYWNRINAAYTTTGSATAALLTYSTGPVSYFKGERIAFWANATNTGAMTININALGAKSILRGNGSALVAGDITTGTFTELVYDGTAFRIVTSEQASPTFSGNLTVGSLTTAGAVNAASLGVSGDITLAGTLKVAPGNGINFANDDTITYNDANNTWTFQSDTVSMPYTSTIATNKLTLIGTSEAIRIDTPAGDIASDPHIGWYKNGTRQGLLQHSDGVGITAGFRMLNDVSGDILVFNNSGDANPLRIWDASANTTHTVWHSGNDGVASTLDADLLDGYEAASLYRNNANHSTTGNLTISNTGPYISLLETNDTSDWQIYLNGGVFSIRQDDNGDGTFEAPNAINLDRLNLRGELWGSKIWTAGNMGAGSTLDADLLDGQEGAYYRSSSNQNAGTLPVARLSGSYTGIVGTGALNAGSITSGFGNVNIGTATFTGNGSGLTTLNATNLSSGTLANARLSGDYSFGNLALTGKLIVGGGYGNGIQFANNDYLWYDDSNNTWSFDADAGAGNGNITVGNIMSAEIWPTFINSSGNIQQGGVNVALSDKTITAGVGLSGGGSLAANRTISMGTPSNITNATTNSVTTTSHTHALGFTAAEVYTGSSAAYASFGLGSILMVHRGGELPDRNASLGVSIRTDNTWGYIASTHALAGTAMAGTWRSRGFVAGDILLMQRTA